MTSNVSLQFDQSQVNYLPCNRKEDIESGQSASYADCALDYVEDLFPSCTFRAFMNLPKSKQLFIR